MAFPVEKACEHHRERAGPLYHPGPFKRGFTPHDPGEGCWDHNQSEEAKGPSLELQGRSYRVLWICLKKSARSPHHT